VTREGNVLRMDERSAVMVAEACSGLRMLTAFVFTAAVLCFLVRRPVWQKAALVASSLPIAVFSNGLRVLITSVWVAAVRDVSVEQRLHDAAGLLMMPLAVLILLGEVKFLGRIWASPANRLRAAVKTARSAAEGLAARRPAARQRG
jgi:exosortase/archaeosortase family protein